jgi:glutathione S-transferase
MRTLSYLLALSYFFRTITICDAFTVVTMSLTSQHILYDVPVSNNGARCRIIMYKKELDETEVRIVPHTDIGGLKSAEFLSLNPQGKIPVLHCPALGFSIPESDTISRYLLTKYADKGPSFLPDDHQSNLLSRFHDFYLTTNQGCLYKDRPPFGIFGTRSDALAEFRKQLGVLDDLLMEQQQQQQYLCGSEVSLADATIFPTMVFAKHMLPKFGFPNALPSKIDAWFENLKLSDPVFQRVYDEVRLAVNVDCLAARYALTSHYCCIVHDNRYMAV